MQIDKFLPFLLVIIYLLLSSCSSSPTIAPVNTPFVPEPKKPTTTLTPVPSNTIAQTNTPLPTNTTTSTPIPTSTSTNTPYPENVPGLIVTLGENIPSPWYPSLTVFSPDGQWIALASSRIRIWDVNTHQLIQELTNPYSEGCYVSNAKFSPDSKLFAVSIASCWTRDPNVGHLLVWDIATGDLLQEWEQENAIMPPSSTSSFEYSIPVYGMAFLPDSSTVIYASGNTLEIKNIFREDEHDVIKLGPKMFASQISLSSDGNLAYIIMLWEKTHEYPSYYREKYNFQAWNIKNHSMLREIKYPEGWVIMNLELHGKYLFHTDFEAWTNQITDLETDKVRDIPLRHGWRFYNADGSLMVFANMLTNYDEEQGIELWNTDNWRNIYTFMPNFGPDWIYSLNDIAFHPDNTIMAIVHEEQVSLWNIRPVVKPQLTLTPSADTP